MADWWTKTERGLSKRCSRLSRLAALPLALLLLTACGTDAEPTASPSASPTPAPPSSVGRDDPGAPPSPSPVPPFPSPAPPSPTPEGAGSSVFLPQGLPEAFPAGGGTVGERFYPGPSLNLAPRDDYGALYPYVGAMLRPDYSGWDSDAKPLYGLCTEDGKIVVDPVYNNVERLESGGHTVYVLQTFHPLEYDLWGVRSETTFAGPNGTWAVTYPACAYHPGGHFYSESVWEAFPVHDGNGWGAVDYAGRLVYPCVEENPVLFGGGLATVLDSETGLYGYKDPQGAWVIEPSYADASAFYGDYAVIVTQQSDVAVIDRGGGFIASFTEWGYVVPLDARRFVVYENAGRLMDASGAVLAEGFGAWLNNGWLSTRLGDSLTRLEKDGVSFELPHTVDYGYPGDRFRVSGPFDENDEESWLWWGLADTNGQILLERPKGQDLNIQPLASGRTLSVRHDKGRGLYGLLDTDLTELIPHKYQFIAEFGEYYAVKEGIYGGLVDQNGTWIVKTVLPGE